VQLGGISWGAPRRSRPLHCILQQDRFSKPGRFQRLNLHRSSTQEQRGPQSPLLNIRVAAVELRPWSRIAPGGGQELEK